MDALLLAEMELLLGLLDAAQGHARTAVELADRSDVPFRRIMTRTLLAEVLHCTGDFEKSHAVFDEAEALQRQHRPEYPQLEGMPGARYCALLLDLAAPLDGTALVPRATPGLGLAEAKQRCIEVHRRVEIMLAWTEWGGFTRFTRGVHRSILGQAHLGLWLAAHAQGMPAEAPDIVAHRNQATAALDQAVDALRQSGRDDTLPRALLARTALYRFLGNAAVAKFDLAGAEELAERAGMRLLACDVHLEHARLALAGNDAAAARADTDAGRKIVSETSYHRRDP